AATQEPGGPRPRVHEAIEAMRNAREHLQQAQGNFHGHREKAIEHLDAAIHEAEICEHERWRLVAKQRQRPRAVTRLRHTAADVPRHSSGWPFGVDRRHRGPRSRLISNWLRWWKLSESVEALSRHGGDRGH